MTNTNAGKDIVEYVMAVKELEDLPEDAYLDPKQMDKLSKALDRKHKAFAALETYLAAEQKAVPGDEKNG